MLTQMKNIVVDFGPVRAVDHVSITIMPGEIVGLLGENGAGKTTLMNALAGSFRPTEGEIYFDDTRADMHSARDAVRCGVRFIHQELNLCNDLNVFENMFLAEELTKTGLLSNILSKKAMAERAAAVFRRMNADIDPWSRVSDLAPSEKQLVEIARALLFDCKLIIMDEPTTALNNNEIENMFDIMRKLSAQGVSFIYISHKMPELFAVCGSFYVMRDGALVAGGRFADVTESQITEMMIGRSLEGESFDGKPCFARSEVAMSASHLSGDEFTDVSFELRRGEIIAVTGLQGSGREALADALFGVVPHTGTLTVSGKTMERGAPIIRYMKSGVAMVPRNRKERGIMKDLSIQDNLSMGWLNTKHKGPLISPKTEAARYLRGAKALSIKANSPRELITTLSGGNQQKVILSRWLETDADVLLFDNPTQGIDVGTKFEIYQLILRLAESGKAILVFSSEFAEIRRIADSCVVLYKGAVNAVLSRGEMSEANIMHYSTGANAEVLSHG
ncbi:MAG: sugar ABC transporter ATP-binding protein [Oscillospiraceae bacterium]|jgi:ribose transport system ATP-binding protein|nr:sugar ABC transporter ATP-binding protein [Oscillospiraceae bacterium]